MKLQLLPFALAGSAPLVQSLVIDNTNSNDTNLETRGDHPDAVYIYNDWDCQGLVQSIGDGAWTSGSHARNCIKLSGLGWTIGLSRLELPYDYHCDVYPTSDCSGDAHFTAGITGTNYWGCTTTTVSWFQSVQCYCKDTNTFTCPNGVPGTG